MSSITDLLRNSQQQYIETVRQTQNAYVDAVSAWARSAEGTTPGVQGAAPLPSAQDVLESSFDFAEQLLQAQREFARNLLSAATPVVERATRETQSAAGKASPTTP